MNWLSNFLSPSGNSDATPWNEDAVYVDVRSSAEFRQGHVHGAINIPLDQFAHSYAKALTDRSQQVIVYCASGGRSSQAMHFLQQQGYTNVVNGISATFVANNTGRSIV